MANIPAKRRVLRKPLFRTEVDDHVSSSNAPSSNRTGHIQRRRRKRVGSHHLPHTPADRDDRGVGEKEKEEEVRERDKRPCFSNSREITPEDPLTNSTPAAPLVKDPPAAPLTNSTPGAPLVNDPPAAPLTNSTPGAPLVNDPPPLNNSTPAAPLSLEPPVKIVSPLREPLSHSLFEEEDLLSGLCPEDLNFSLNTSLTTTTTPRPQPIPRYTGSPHSVPEAVDRDSGMASECVAGVGEEGGEREERGSFFGLPSLVRSLLKEHRGIDQLYAWQEQCLSLPRVLAGGNLIYSLPTSGGKTLVAEILILRQLLLRERDSLLVLPYVSIVQEKVRDLAPFATALEFAVEEYAGSRGKFPPLRRRRKRVVYVATIEKANGLVNSLAELDRLGDLGLVVVDELHMLGDGTVRGATLESCLTKILCLSSGTQVVGMSATLSNTAELASFLRAESFSSEFRPVELREYVKLGKCVYSVRAVRGEVSLHPERELNSKLASSDPDDLVALVSEVLPHSSCLIFCPTKKLCQNVALLLARNLPRFHSNPKAGPRSMLLRSLAVEAQGVCPVLARTVPVGVAYHHSGLTADERRLVEEGYCHGNLSILCCTSTLAAGVNLPARRVILRSPRVGSQYLSHSQYKQMVGRAGRKGLSEAGESILITTEADKHKVLDLLSSSYDRCDSSLMCEGSTPLAALILSLVGLKLALTTSDLQCFLKATLCYQQSRDHTYFLSRCQETVDSLVADGYITMEMTDGGLVTTALGRAAVRGCVPVQSAARVYRELSHAQSSLVLSTNLHLLFLATPTEHTPSIRPNWPVFFQTLTGLSEDEMRVAEMVGVRPSLLSKLATGSGGNMSQEVSLVYQRFYLSLMIHRLIASAGGGAKEAGGVWSVADHFQCSRGFVQSAVSSVASFATCLVHFTQELPGLWALHLLLPSVAQQLSHAVTSDLIPLMEIPGVRQGRARQLLQAGYSTPESLSSLSPRELCECVDHLYPKQAKRIIQAAKALLKDKAELLLEEAESLMARATVTHKLNSSLSV